MALEPVVYEATGRRFTGFLADGSRGRTVPGVLIAHESGGLDTNVKLRAGMLAELGYVAFAMDLFGEEPRELARMQELSKELRSDLNRQLAITQVALGILIEHPNVDSSRLAAIGYCLGGAVVLDLARTGVDIGCVVGFHAGLAMGRPEKVGEIKARVLICHGADDPVIGADQRDAFIAEMTAAKANWQLHLYGGVGHSFTNRDIGRWNLPGFAYDEVADRRSWRAMLDLFDETFGPSPSQTP